MDNNDYDFPPRTEPVPKRIPIMFFGWLGHRHSALIRTLMAYTSHHAKCTPKDFAAEAPFVGKSEVSRYSRLNKLQRRAVFTGRFQSPLHGTRHSADMAFLNPFFVLTNLATPSRFQ
jgi:hypothetical protein